MAKYLVRCKASVYYDVEVEAKDKSDARDMGEGELAELLDEASLPNSLEWEGLEAWEVEELDD